MTGQKTKRRYRPKPKPGELVVWYGKSEPGQLRSDLCTAGGGDGANDLDAAALWDMLCRNPAASIESPEHRTHWPFRCVIDELEARGYDLSTLRFSIRRRADP